MVKILKPPEKKNNVITIANKNSNSNVSTKMPKYFGFKDKDPFRK